MKRTAAILLTIIAMCSWSCTQNHGHIGRLFGSWYLYDMTVDGDTPDDFDYAELFWSFQSDVIRVTERFPYHVAGKSYGTWTETESTLTLNFTHSDPSHPAGTHGYRPPEILGFNCTDPIVLTYLEKEKNTMTLEQRRADGKTYVYFLKRTH
ncbi:MAG: lipocalin-like domain-containing protein [Muribaculaceae bacterium]|nr:lipocalin-like domain-containing protein [Muribaculaceae bacterium]